ncbi:MAG: hypothetical protein AAGH60_14610 [Pseudomonadota bacterium]
MPAGALNFERIISAIAVGAILAGAGSVVHMTTRIALVEEQIESIKENLIFRAERDRAEFDRRVGQLERRVYDLEHPQN